MRGLSFTEEQEKKIIALYTAGVGYATIASQMRIKGGQVRRLLQERGLLRTRAEGFKARLELSKDMSTTYDIEKALKL